MRALPWRGPVWEGRWWINTDSMGAQMEVCRRFCGTKQQEVKEGFPEEATLEEPKGEHGERMKAF